MSPERIKEIYTDFQRALERLMEALKTDIRDNTIAVDGTIQRFEFTFELAWKLAGSILKYQGIEADTPRSVIKDAFKAKLLKDGEAWIDMLEDRNKTSHIYDEKAAMVIYEKIKSNHYRILEEFGRIVMKSIEN